MKTPTGKLLISIVLVLAAAAFFSSNLAAQTQRGFGAQERFAYSDIVTTLPPENKLDYVLKETLRLYDEKRDDQARDFLKRRSPEDSIEFKGTDIILRVEIRAMKDTEEKVIQFIRQNGGEVVISYKNLIGAEISPLLLKELIRLNEVRFIEQNVPPTPTDDPPAANNIVSDGVKIIGANLWHQAGYDGKGTKVAIIDTDFLKYKDAIALGELPANVETKEFSYKPFGIDGKEGHGTQCAMIVHDVAPGAELLLVQDDSFKASWLKAIDYLIKEKVAIVSNSSVFLSPGPFDGSSQVSQKIKEAVDSGITWINVSSNSARDHWEGYFKNNGSNLHIWKDGKIRQKFNLTGGCFVVDLTWNDWAYDVDGFPVGNKTGQDYKLKLYNKDNKLYAETDVVQKENPEADPHEGLSIASNTYPVGEYELEIEAKGSTGEAPNYLELYSWYKFEDPVIQSSLPITADVKEAITVGMAYDQKLMENSGRGPINSSGGGAPDPTDKSLIKPDLLGPTWVETFPGVLLSGTSAAAPHIAGAVALIKQAKGLKDPAAIKAYLEKFTAPLPGYPAEKNNDTGSGLLFLADSSVLKNAPQINNISPASVPKGFSGTVEITGLNFDKDSKVGFGTKITVTETKYINPNKLTATLSVASDVAPGPYDVSIISNKKLLWTGKGLFSILENILSISEVFPNIGEKGWSGEVLITSPKNTPKDLQLLGDFGHFLTIYDDKGPKYGKIDFGPGIKITKTEYFGWGSKVICTLDIDPTAEVGPRDISITILDEEGLIEMVKTQYPGYFKDDSAALAFVKGFNYQYEGKNGLEMGKTIKVGTNSFTVTDEPPTPIIEYIDPSMGKQGSSFKVEISGKYLRKDSILNFGDKISTATTSVKNALLQKVADTSSHTVNALTASVKIEPNAVVGKRTITIANKNKVGSASFEVIPIGPVIASVSPAEIAQGSLVNLTIQGTGFDSQTKLELGEGITINKTFTNSSSFFTANISISADAKLGPRDVKVINSDGLSSVLVAGLKIIAAESIKAVEPVIDSISPYSVEVGTTVDITINGKNFEKDSKLTAHKNITIQKLEFIDSGTLKATIVIAQDAEPGYKWLQVTNSNSKFYDSNINVLPIPPIKISDCNPKEGETGWSGQVKISGQNVKNGVEVSFGEGITVANVTVNNSQEIEATIAIAPNARVGWRTIEAKNPDGKINSLYSGFEVKAKNTPNPTINSATPNSAVPGWSGKIVIYGDNIVEGAIIKDAKGDIVGRAYEYDGVPNYLSVDIEVPNTATTGGHEITVINPDGDEAPFIFHVTPKTFIIDLNNLFKFLPKFWGK